MIIPKLALKNILGAGLRTWLNVFVLSLSFVLIIFSQGLLEGMNQQAEEAMIASEIGGGHYQHPAYDPYDPLSLRDAHGPVPAALAAMADAGKSDWKTELVPAADSPLSCIRVAFYAHQVSEALDMIRHAAELGYETTANLMAVSNITEEEIDTVLDVIRKTCRTRKRYINPLPSGAEPAHLSMAAPAYPLEVIVGGATVFMIDVAQFERLGRGAAPEGALPRSKSGSSAGGGKAMQMVVSIVAADDAEPVTRALISAGYRVTRMNTAGGFFRRGNVTLLVGVEQPQVDDVLRVIDERNAFIMNSLLREVVRSGTATRA